MGVYVNIDLEATDDGDLVLDAIGDLKIASPIRTMAQAVNTAVLTNKGDLIGDPLWGANLEDFIGERNTIQTREFMRLNIVDAIREQGLAVAEDVDIDVIPTDVNTVAILIIILGSYFNTELDNDNFGRFVQPEQGIEMAYNYPYIGGLITRLATS
jgi:hypothetical protein